MYEYVLIRTSFKDAGIVQFKRRSFFNNYFAWMHTSIRTNMQCTNRTYSFINYIQLCNIELDSRCRSDQLQYPIPDCRNRRVVIHNVHDNLKVCERTYSFIKL